MTVICVEVIVIPVKKIITNKPICLVRSFIECCSRASKSAALHLLITTAMPICITVNTISANDFSFYEELNGVVQNEPAEFVEPETVGLFAAIGIRKGQPFAPDARMTKILTDAVALGNSMAIDLEGRAIGWTNATDAETANPAALMATAGLTFHF